MIGPFEKGEAPYIGISLSDNSGTPDSVNLIVIEPDETETAYSCSWNSSLEVWETNGHRFDQVETHKLAFVAYVSSAVADVHHFTVEVNDSEFTYPYETP